MAMQKEFNDQMALKALFEHSTVGIIIVNKNGVIEKCNSYGAEVFGFEVDEILGKEIEELLPEGIRKKHTTYREEYVRDEQYAY